MWVFLVTEILFFGGLFLTYTVNRHSYFPAFGVGGDILELKRGAAHTVVGAGLLIWLIQQSFKGRFTAEYNTPVEMVGLYWHFIDIVWIYLFALLYLISRHPA